MKLIGAVLFTVGVLLAVRVMFFGVRLQAAHDQFKLRGSRLAIAAIFAAIGALVYARSSLGHMVTLGWLPSVVVVGAVAGTAAWWVVRASALAGSVDPEDDPRYRFQGCVARVVDSMQGSGSTGRIAFLLDGQRLEMVARWLPEHLVASVDGAVDSEVVIGHVDGDVAYVEPWAVVEARL
jgi:hypothetical protein